MTVRRIAIAGAAALAACGVLGMAPAAVQAGSPSIPGWTKRASATSPVDRVDAAMAYDAATGTAVLFGGATAYRILDDTWTWDDPQPGRRPSPHREIGVWRRLTLLALGPS
jgi:hypothetical protein